MAQPVEVMAFRKRLRKRGYRDIRIQHIKGDVYLVEALEPLAGMGVQVELGIDDVVRLMR